MAAKQTEPDVLVSPDGDREWTPEDAVQATNLRARGWTPKPAAKAKSATPATTSN